MLAQGTLGGQGRDSRTYEIVCDPGGAAGLTVYAQAGFGVSLWLGNRQTLTFSDF